MTLTFSSPQIAFEFYSCLIFLSMEIRRTNELWLHINSGPKKAFHAMNPMKVRFHDVHCFLSVHCVNKVNIISVETIFNSHFHQNRFLLAFHWFKLYFICCCHSYCTIHVLRFTSHSAFNTVQNYKNALNNKTHTHTVHETVHNDWTFSIRVSFCIEAWGKAY